MDYIASLGALTLDHRLKRVMNHLLSEAERVYQMLDLPFKSKWVSTYLLLADDAPLTVTDIAARVRVSHPAVIQITREMIEYRLVRSTSDKKDARRRLVFLTAKGKRLEPQLRKVWRALASAQEDIFRAAGWDLPAMMDSIDEELKMQSIAEAAVARMPQQIARARSNEFVKST